MNCNVSIPGNNVTLNLDNICIIYQSNYCKKLDL